MKLRAQTALVGLALAAIALLLLGAWWWLRTERAAADSASRDATAAVASDPRTASLESTARIGDSSDAADAAALDAATAATVARAAVGALDAAAVRVRVRSSVGLPLARVEVRGADALWQPYKLVDGVATLASIALPLQARAPGHAARQFESLGAPVDGAHVLELVPESLVVIDDPGEWLPSGVLPFASEDAPLRDLSSLLSHGRIGARSYALAFDSERLLARRMHELELGIGMRGCGTLHCKVRIAEGLRAHGALPADAADQPRAPLVVRVHPDSRRGGPWLLRIALADTARSQWIRADASYRVVGDLRAKPQSFEASDVRAEPTWTFDAALLERDYTYALFDLATGASALGTLRHLGEPIELRLNAGCVIAGRVRVPAGEALPASIDVTVQWSEPPSRVSWRRARSMWNTQTREGVPLARDGSFEVACFDAIPDAYEGRGLLSVQLDSAAFASGFREVEVERAPRHDLGVVELAAPAPGIVVAGGTDVWPRSHFRTWLSAAGVTHDVIRIVERPDNSLVVRTAETVDAAAVALQWITESRSRGRLFLERDGGVHRPAQVAARTIELAIEPGEDPDRFWRLALCWRDACVDLDEVRATQAGEVLVRSYAVPEGTRLAWTPFRQLNAGVSPPLEPARSVALDVPAGAPPPRAVLR